jgi:hypothetical protein
MDTDVEGFNMSRKDRHAAQSTEGLEGGISSTQELVLLEVDKNEYMALLYFQRYSYKSRVWVRG